MDKNGNRKTQKTKKFDSTEMFKIFHNNNFDELLEFVNKYGIDSVDREGRNVLINCVISNKKEWVTYILKQFTELDINTKDNSGWSALHFAASGNNVEIVDLLLKHKTIDLNVTDDYGRTPLMNILHKNNAANAEDIIIKLLDAGGDINKGDNGEKKPHEYLMLKVNTYLREKNIKIIK
jgi:ankyrin repeat protein